MKRPRSNRSRSNRPARPTARPNFDAALCAYVETHCPQHFTTRAGQRAITPQGVQAYLEAVVRGETPGDRESALEGIHLIKQIVQFRNAKNATP